MPESLPAQGLLRFWVCSLHLIGLAFVPAAPAAQLLRDINTQVQQESSNPRQFTTMGAITFFVADDDDHGAELWRTDGTAAGTYLLSDIRPGPDTSYPEDFVVANGLLYFSADDGVNGREVWRSDGTVGGTYMLADIAPGSASGFVGTTVTITGAPSLYYITTVTSRYPIVPSGPYVYFIASDGPSGAELWRSDGTAAGTIKLTDLAAAYTTTAPINYMTPFGSRLAFTAVDSVAGEELWISDGTPAGTMRVADINAGTASSSPDQLTAAGPLLFFTANDGQHGRELWCTDGTANGTRLVSDITAGTTDTQLTNLTAAGNQIYFIANQQLWRSDGSTATAVTAATNQVPRYLTRFGSHVVYRAGDLSSASTPAELWITDGTDTGTVRLFQSTSADTYGRRNGGPLVVGGKLYFTDQTPTDGAGIWSSDGTSAGTALVSATQLSGAVPDVIADTLKLVGATTDLAFFITPNAQFVDGLWRTDGTPSGTFRLADLRQTGSNTYFQGIATAGALAYFTPYDSVIGTELSVTDGTVSGTHTVKDIATLTANGSSSPTDFTAVGGKVLFAASSSYIPQLWSTDGTTSGTQLVVDVAPNAPNTTSGGVWQIVNVGSHTLIVARTPATGMELWTTDGTAAGTVLLKDLVPGPEGGGPDLHSGAFLNGTLIFPAVSDSGIQSIWKTDGTAAGTTLLYSFAQSNIGPPYSLVTAGAYVYFAVTDPNDYGSKTLWRTDGTPAGTQPALAASTKISSIAGSAGGFLFYQGTDSSVWRTDGTPAGTIPVISFQELLSDAVQKGYSLGHNLIFGICPFGGRCGLYVSDGSANGTSRLADTTLTAFSDVVTVGNQLFFTATAPYSAEPVPWVTDGTPSGTHQIQPSTPDLSYPSSYVSFGGVALFAALSSRYGSSIWRTDGTTAGTRLVAAGPVPVTPVTSYQPVPKGFSAYNLESIGSQLFFAGSNWYSGSEPFVLTATDPVAGDDRYIISPPALTRLPVLDNDGIVNGSIDRSSLAIVASPTLGTASVDTTTGQIVYTPTVTAGRDTLTYTVKSAAGTTSNTARVDIIIGGADGANPNDPPTISLKVDPTSFQTPPTQQVTLTWSVSANATSCAASGGWTGSKAISGSESVGPISQTSTFTLTCDAPGGSASQTATVTVSSAPSGGGTGGSSNGGGSGSGSGAGASSGGGGGGGIGVWEIALLALLLALAKSRIPNAPSRSLPARRPRRQGLPPSV